MNRLLLENLSIKLRQISMDLARDGGTGAEYAKDIAFADLVIFEMGSQLYPNYEAAPLPPAPAEKPEKKKAGGKRAPKGAGAHRHKFTDAGTCACGAKRQRAPKGSGALSAEARTVPLPMPEVRSRPTLGEYEADPFADGAMGSSGVTRK
jgi:hypothetical protein